MYFRGNCNVVVVEDIECISQCGCIGYCGIGCDVDGIVIGYVGQQQIVNVCWMVCYSQVFIFDGGQVVLYVVYFVDGCVGG